MQLSKTFLTGILVFALVFGMTLAGCDNGSTSDGGDGGGGNPLLGSWVDDRDLPDGSVVAIFTDANSTTVGAKIAYYSINLGDEQATATATQVTIDGESYTYSLSGNTLTVNNYEVDAQGNRSNVEFLRAAGTTGTSINGIWVSNLGNTNNFYTLLIIRGGTSRIHTSVGSANWGESPYVPSEDPTGTFVNWGRGPVSYSKSNDPTLLTITLPIGGRQTGLMTLSNW
jgi:hypothetical protein